MKFNELGRSFFRKMVQIRRYFVTKCTIRSTRGAKLPIDATFSESLEKSLDKVVSRSEKNFSVHKKYMNFFQYRKTALDEHLYKLSAGRSMVEMLGVLAIIGVLSIGAIAGYSKAMMKYKLNKQAEAFNIFLNNAIYLRDIFNKAPDGSDFNCNIMDKLGYIPDGMICKNNNIYDNFNNLTIFHYSYSANGLVTYYLDTSFAISNNKMTEQSLEICRNMILTAKENADNIYLVSIRSGQDDGSYTANSLNGNYQNNNSDRSKKLYNASITQIDDLCRTCESKNYCSIVIYLQIRK